MGRGGSGLGYGFSTMGCAFVKLNLTHVPLTLIYEDYYFKPRVDPDRFHIEAVNLNRIRTLGLKN